MCRFALSAGQEAASRAFFPSPQQGCHIHICDNASHVPGSSTPWTNASGYEQNSTSLGNAVMSTWE